MVDVTASLVGNVKNELLGVAVAVAAVGRNARQVVKTTTLAGALLALA
jgi:hypothetical protein